MALVKGSSIIISGQSSATLYISAYIQPSYPGFGENDFPYICKNIDGLDSPQIDVNIPDYNGTTPNKGGYAAQGRELVFLFGLNPYYYPDSYINQTTVPSTYSFGKSNTFYRLRKNLYRLMNDNYSNVCVIEFATYYTDTSIPPEQRLIRGYITNVEVSLFSAEPEVQVTIFCPDPYFQHYSLRSQYFGEDLIVVENRGTAPVPFFYETQVFANTSTLTLTDITPDPNGNPLNKKMQIDYPFLTNDLLDINMVPGKRYIKVWRSGVGVTDITGYLSADSTWLKLHATGGDPNTYLQLSNAGTTSYRYTYVRYYEKDWGL